MRLAIMQPYFLPYLGYFSLIAATDHFVVFDSVQYIRHGWINRNRILKPGFSQPQYIQIPIAKHSRQTTIRDIKISENEDWKQKIFRQIRHYEKRAPYYKQAEEILENCLKLETDSIVDLNVHCLTTICRVLEIDFQHSRVEPLEQDLETAQHPGEWAVMISEALGAEAYINPVAGRALFQPQQFRQRGIELRFLENSLTRYPQRNQDFIPGLSILDILMFNSPEETRNHIADYRISVS